MDFIALPLRPDKWQQRKHQILNLHRQRSSKITMIHIFTCIYSNPYIKIMRVKLSINHRSTSRANLYASRICQMFDCCSGFEAIFRAKSIGSIFSFAFCAVSLILIQWQSRLAFSCDAVSKISLSLRRGTLLGFFVISITSQKNVGIRAHLYSKLKNYTQIICFLYRTDAI